MTRSVSERGLIDRPLGIDYKNMDTCRIEGASLRINRVGICLYLVFVNTSSIMDETQIHIYR